MSTGFSPVDLLDERVDESLLEAIADAHDERRWDDTHELLAQTVELLHELILTTLRVSPFVRVTSLPPPYRIKRPGQEPAPLSMGQMARMLTRGG